MSFFEDLKKAQTKSPIVHVPFPSERPALELQVQRITQSELAGIQADALAGLRSDADDEAKDRLFQVAILNGMIAAIKKNTKNWKGLDADCPPFSKVELDAFFNFLNLGMKGDLRQSYLKAAAGSADFLDQSSEKPSKDV